VPINRLRAGDDLAASTWIAPRLGGGFGAVTRFVPRGYPAYVRICHPATHPDGTLATWASVAHPLMQWTSLAGTPERANPGASLWRGAEPRVGHLIPELLAPLCQLLADHTTTPEDCYFGLWNGWGWIPSTSDRTTLNPTADSNTAALQHALHVIHPGREYLLLAGPLQAALEIGHWPSPDWFVTQSPNITWPADRAWLMATEIDFDSTLIGGNAHLIDTLLAAPDLESWPVGPDDSLAIDADEINPTA
jgi:hypothetical protein